MTKYEVILDKAVVLASYITVGLGITIIPLAELDAQILQRIGGKEVAVTVGEDDYETGYYLDTQDVHISVHH